MTSLKLPLKSDQLIPGRKIMFRFLMNRFRNLNIIFIYGEQNEESRKIYDNNNGQ